MGGKLMNDYRIVEKRNCFNTSRFYVEVKIGRIWADIQLARGEILFFKSYGDAFDYITNQYHSMYTDTVGIIEVTREDVLKGN